MAKRSSGPRHPPADAERALFDALPCGSVLLGPDHTVLAANRACAARLGYDAADLRGRRYDALAVEADGPLLERQLAIAATGAAPPPVDARLLHADGRSVWSRLMLAPRGDAAGAAAEWCVALHDVAPPDERTLHDKRSEAFSDASEGMALLDDTWRHVYANGAYLSLLGYAEASDLVGRPWHDLFPAEEATRLEAEVGPVLARDGQWTGEALGRRLDGHEFAEAISLTRLASGGLLCVIRDITDRKRLEERFRRAVEAAPNAMVMVRANGRIVLVNAQTEQMFGYARAELVGQMLEILVPRRFHGSHEGFRGSFFDRPSVRPMGGGRELHGVRKNGTEFPVEIGLNPIDTDEGQMVLGAIVDITERKRAEEQLRTSLREKDALLQEVHHRVKNNLQVISSLLNLQARAVNDPRTEQVVRDCQARLRAMSLIHETLYRSTDISLINFAAYAERLSHHIADANGLDARAIRLVTEVQPVDLNIDTAISCGLIINELVSNSLKHAFPEDPGAIHVSLRSSAEHGIELTVRDDGIGLPEDVPAADSALGMRIVRALTRQLEGSFEFVPQDQGSLARLRFRVTA